LTKSFLDDAHIQHEEFLDAFESYRDQLTEVLFYGERISRSELTEGKQRVLQSLRDHIHSVQNTLLPAITSSDGELPVNGVELFADVQDNLLTIAKKTEDNIDFFANPDAPKEDRNDAARETLKDLYRLDSALNLYFRLLEDHLLVAGEQELASDEKDELLLPFSSLS